MFRNIQFTLSLWLIITYRFVIKKLFILFLLSCLLRVDLVYSEILCETITKSIRFIWKITLLGRYNFLFVLNKLRRFLNKVSWLVIWFLGKVSLFKRVLPWLERFLIFYTCVQRVVSTTITTYVIGTQVFKCLSRGISWTRSGTMILVQNWLRKLSLIKRFVIYILRLLWIILVELLKLLCLSLVVLARELLTLIILAQVITRVLWLCPLWIYHLLVVWLVYTLLRIEILLLKYSFLWFNKHSSSVLG
jgi:hypothetical protein